MSKTVSAIRKVLALMIGLPLVVVGFILIPLPGPGLLIMFAGLFIISLEFDWAKKYVESIQAKIRGIFTSSQRRADEFVQKHDKS